MTEPPPFERMSDLLSRYGPDLKRFDREWTAPVLVRRRDATPSVDLKPAGFHTQIQDSSAVDMALRETRETVGVSALHPNAIHSPGVPLPEDVIRLEKKAGGAFAGRIGIGRAPKVDVQILLAKVSKYHAYVTIADDGLVHLADARSSFGTFVDGQQLDELEPVALDDGVAVRLATYEFRFHTSAGLREAIARMHRLATR